MFCEPQISLIRCGTVMLAVLPLVAAYSVNCGPRHEAVQNRNHSIVCQGIATGSDVIWKFIPESGTPVTVGTCGADGVCDGDNSQDYEVTREGDQSTVHVQNVSRDGQHVKGEWRCEQGSQQQSCFILHVVSLPVLSGGQCNVTFNEDNVDAVCHITRVFPLASCHWRYNRECETMATVPSSYLAYNTLRKYTEDGNDYFEVDCRINRMPLPTGLGEYIFDVTISPGDVNPVVTFASTNTVAAPDKPVLVDCITTRYIDFDKMAPEDAVCTCSAPNRGSPPGRVHWLGPEGRVLVTSDEARVALPLRHVDKRSSGKEYTCVVRHHTGDKETAFKPRIAYGPPWVNVSSEKTESNFTVRCTAGASSPLPSFSWSGVDSFTQIGNGTEQQGAFYVNGITLTSGCEVTCTATNQETSAAKSASASLNPDDCGDIAKTIAIAVGASVGFVILVVVVAVVICCCTRRACFKEAQFVE